jgi:hypothetical protein
MDVGQQGRGVGALESEGLRSSLLAGAIFGAAEVLGAALLQGNPLWPIEAPASLFAQEHAFDASFLAFAVPISVLVHFSLVTTYGFLYGLMSSDARLSTRLDARREAGLGALFGAGIWLINFQLVARLFYPWIFATNQLAQFVLHVGFGVLLAMLFRRKEQRRIAVARIANRPA